MLGSLVGGLGRAVSTATAPVTGGGSSSVQQPAPPPPSPPEQVETQAPPSSGATPLVVTTEPSAPTAPPPSQQATPATPVSSAPANQVSSAAARGPSSVEDPETAKPLADVDQARNAAMAAWQAHKVSTMIERISNPETAHVVTLLKKEAPESDARAAYAEAGEGFGDKPAARERQASQTP